MGLSETASTGDRRRTLEELRDVLAQAIDAGPPARDLSPLSRQFAAVLKELGELAPARKDDAVDEVTARRSKRRAS
jgi:hypothetical protein